MINFEEGKIVNAKIKYTFLGVDEDGVVRIQIGFDYEGEKTIAFVNKNVSRDFDFIKTILNTLDVRSWEDLPRKYARIRILDGKVAGIGNIIEDRWVRL